MSDTTLEVMRDEMEGNRVTVPLSDTAATYKRGHLIELDANGYGDMAGDDASVRFAGIATEEVVVPSGASDGDYGVVCQQKGLHLFTFTSTLTQADLEMAAYAADNYRAARVGDVSNALFIGIIKRIVSSTQAWVDIEPAIPAKYTLANAVS